MKFNFPEKKDIYDKINSLIPRKISGTFYAKSREKYMEFEENNEEFEGKMTRNLKEK
jgi:hypothetical protein